MKPLRAALYARVSTDQQTVDQQVYELRAEAERRGWSVAEVFAEQGSGGDANRPERARMMQGAALNRFDVVVVYALDRFTRSTLDLLACLQALEERGVAFVSLREAGIDTSTPHGRMVVTVLGAVAELERSLIRERTRLGLARVKRQGSKTGNAIGRPAVALDLAAVRARIAAGEPVAAVARSLTYRTKSGKVRAVSVRTLTRRLHHDEAGTKDGGGVL